ncbi:MAG: DUF262 domain-containing protein [Aestuariivita sp.]|nr:DUF262 domain-containing protein [Aestuariivita sp.]MCY4201602.1 DUF262 domain-containing protein [Aestuariivita sp.]MCY4287998.1 DUF262 domain-containing protein [Aestuariivita sp.]MCY4347591.1 DUF262 domain-containing protein [Aestuariivita sp.]
MITDQEKSIDDVTPVSGEDISSWEGIDDDTELESTLKEPYSIRSYGADYTVDSLVKRMDTEAFIVPSFQRRFVWNLTHSSRFIESLLMGLPVPGIFLYKRPEDGRQLVIDGQQRLKTLQGFYQEMFKEKKFRLAGVREPWNGLTYHELDFDDQLRLDDSIVHAVIFSQESPKDSIDSIHFVFERINSGGARLSAQEIRNCIAEGPFTALTDELNRNNDWRNIYGNPSARAKDQELITRVLAFFERPDDYKRPMATFLTKFTQDMNSEPTQKLQFLKATFEEVCSLSWEALKNRAFRPVRTINAAVLESVMSALARRLQDAGPPPKAHAVAKAYKELLSSDRYRSGWESGTADEEKVRIRVELARDAFSSL